MTPVRRLGYGRARPRRRRWWAWGLLVAALVLAAAGYRYRQPLWAKATFLAFERRCLTYARPAEFAVFSELPEDVRDFPAREPQPAAGRYQVFPARREYVAHVYFTPDVWAQHPLCRWEPGPALLHARRTPGGKSRLVGVDLSPMGEFLALYPRVIVPAGLTTTSRGILNRFDLFMVRSPDDRVRVFAGQPDPNDASHFTIAYEVNGTPGVIDGWLLEDDTVQLHPRAGRRTSKKYGDVAWTPVASKHFVFPDDGPVVPHAKP